MIASFIFAFALASTPHGVGGCAIKRDVRGHIARSRVVYTQFLKQRGLRHTPSCIEMRLKNYPGCHCQVDHIIALACGGCDQQENLQLICGRVLERKERQELRCGK